MTHTGHTHMTQARERTDPARRLRALLRSRVTPLCAGAASLLLLSACGGVTTVEVATASSRSINATVGGVGPVAATVSVPVAFALPGFKAEVLVENIDVVLGSEVSAGQPLINIDPAPLQSNRSTLVADLTQALAEQAAAAAHLTSGSLGTTIAEQQTKVQLAQIALQDAEATLASADSAHRAKDATAVAKAQASLQAAQTGLAADEGNQGASLRELQTAYAAATARANLVQQAVNIAEGEQPVITAPVAGYVAAINVQAGVFAQPGKTLVQIVDPSHIQVTATLPVADVSLATVGAPAELSFADLPNVFLSGTVTGVAPSSTNSGTGFQVLVSANNTSSNSVLPGLQAYVQISTTRQAVVAIPTMAISDIDQDPYVFVVHGNTVTRQPIAVGAVDNQWAQVISGLNVGDKVVTVGYQSLNDGSRVSVSGTS